MYLRIRLLDDERDALAKLAAREHRTMQQMAAYLVRSALKQRGVLFDDDVQEVERHELDKRRLESAND